MSIYFSDDELACKHCGILRLAEGFIEKLDNLRIAVDFPMKINSCCRCPEHNEAVGGKKGSFHLTSHIWGCCAVDVDMTGWDSKKRWAFIWAAMTRGWSIGINWSKNFVHLDRRTDYQTGWSKPAFFPY